MRIFGEKNVGGVQDKIIAILEQTKLPKRLSDLDIDRTSLETIVNESYSPERMNNNPKIPTKEELKTLLLELI